MARGKLRAWRSIVVSQASLVWAITNKDLDPHSLVDFIETGIFSAERSETIRYSPAILQGLHESGVFFAPQK